MRQNDLKLLVAFGTVSQLGFLIILFGIGTPAATTAGCEMLLAHAIFKCAEFMAVGTVDHHTGTRDRRRIPALGPGWRPFGVARRPEHRVDGRDPARARLHRQGGRARRARPHRAGARLTGARRGRRRLDAHRRLLRPPAVGDVRPARPPRRARTSRSTSRAARPACWSARSPCSPRRRCCSAWSPACSTTSPAAPPRRSTPRMHGVHLALWHGSTLALLLSAVALVGGLAMFAGRRRVGAGAARRQPGPRRRHRVRGDPARRQPRAPRA